MSFTTHRGTAPPGLAHPAGPVPGGGGPTNLLPVRARRRQPALAAAGLVLTVGGAAISAALVLNAGNTVGVLTVVRDVPAGARLAQADLGVARVSGSGVSALRARESRVVVGRTTLSAIPRGTLLNAAMLTEAPIPAPGEAAVGIQLAPGNTPSISLAGRVVAVFRLAKDPDGGGQAVLLVPRARVISAERDESGTGKVLVTLVTDAGSAAAVLQASADEQVGLALLPVGS